MRKTGHKRCNQKILMDTLALSGSHRFHSGIRQAIGRHQRQATFSQQCHSFLLAGPFQAYHYRQMDAHLGCGLNNTFCQQITTGDAAKAFARA